MYEKTINISPQRIPSLTDIEYKPRSLQPTTVEQIISRKKRFNAHVSQAAKRCRELYSVAEKPSKPNKPFLMPSQPKAPIGSAYSEVVKNKIASEIRSEHKANKVIELERRIAQKEEDLARRKEINENAKNSMEQIALEVAKKYISIGVTRNDIFSNRRSKEVVAARQEVFYRAKNETINSLPAIGRYFGDKDHTTVLHGIRKYEQLQKDPSVKKWLPEHLILPVNYLELAGEK